MSNTSTGWELNNRVHFDDNVEKYDKVRWDYPAKLFEDVLEYAGGGKGKAALEIGAGTGRATVPFLDSGCTVTAIEMGGNMAEFLREKFKGNKRFNVINATFEDIMLVKSHYDLVYAASAFHWVDTDIGCPKVFRILKSGGTFALFRNKFVPADGEDLFEDIQAVYNEHFNSSHTLAEKPIKLSKEDFWKPSEIYKSFRFIGLEDYGFSNITMNLYEMTLTFSADEYISLMDTFPDHRALPDSNREALFAGVREAIVRHGGYRKLDNTVQLYMGRKL